MYTTRNPLINAMSCHFYSVICILCLLLILPSIATAQKISFDEIKSKCKDSAYDSRVRLTVARFSVSTLDAQHKFGGELATMLSNGLQQTNCFRVLESVTNADDLTGEIAFGQSGMTNGSSSPQSGKMLGAQVVVTGEVTEYNEGKGGATIGGFSLGTSKARLGFILKIVNPTTREILFSQSINVIGRKNGLSGLSLGRIGILGSNTQNKAFSNAIEQAILQACAVLVENKDMIALPEANTGVGESITYNRSNCPLLGISAPPSVMIIVPEVHIQRPIPDPAGETEIIKRFIEAGFNVIDPSVYDDIRNTEETRNAAKDSNVARSIADQYGADIIIVGEAFSERSNDTGGMITCRARVEVRAVRTKDARILAANGTHAGGSDITESSSAKISLRNAGSKMADYLLQTLCNQ